MTENRDNREFFSIENTSILRKFTILFFLMSVIPVVLLFYIYLQVKEHASIEMTAASLEVTLIVVVLGVLVGYVAMRSVIKKLMLLTNANVKAIENLLNPGKVKELSEEKNEIAVLAQAFNAITTRLEENLKSLELTRKTLHTVMSKVGQGIANMQNIDSFLELILQTITDGLSSKVGTLLIYSTKFNDVYVKTAYGLKPHEFENVRLKLDDLKEFGLLLHNKQPFVVFKDSSSAEALRKYAKLFPLPMICAPLYISKDNILGIICIGEKKDNENYTEDEMVLLSNLASQTAVAIENSRLSQDLEKTYFETISALALAVDAKDPYSRGHLDRVALFCVRIAVRLGLEEEDMRTLRDAARLHDLGKIGISDDVLRKQGPLTEQEWILMRRHPEIGESIIKPIRSLQHLCDIIRHHHEKLDGTGYPDGLKGDEITPLVRITMVADIYDALTTNRPYRDRLSQPMACAELRKMKDKIDQEIVEVFIETLNDAN